MHIQYWEIRQCLDSCARWWHRNVFELPVVTFYVSLGEDYNRVGHNLYFYPLLHWQWQMAFGTFRKNKNFSLFRDSVYIPTHYW